MADPQRTHPATPKRVKEFRKRGEIALSRDVVSAATLGGGVIALLACAGAAGSSLLSLTRDAALATDGRDAVGLPAAAARTFGKAAAPVMIAAAIAAFIAIMLQLGFPPVFKKLSLDFSKISPGSNLMQAFSPAAMGRRTAMALAKLIVVGALVIASIKSSVTTDAIEAGAIGEFAWGTISHVLWIVLGALVAIAAGDYILSRRKLANRMKMTADEIKREHRENEGDPMIRGKRRAKMRELAKRRIAQAVSKADVVVVNPTHYAVALRYDDKKDRAPIVVAKGTDEVAEKIREIARKHAVPVLARPPLARALHKLVKEGQPIPVNLFRAVAEVLAYVYRLKAPGRKAAAS